MVVRWPWPVERLLQARNLQRKEARAAGVWRVRPRLWRFQVGHKEVAEACPELNKPFVEPPLRGFGIMEKVTLGNEILKTLRFDATKSIEDAAIRGMLDAPHREIWDHDGARACGRKSYSLIARTVSRQRPWITAAEIVRAHLQGEGSGRKGQSTLV